MTQVKCDIAVVGAGPAGLHAALAARDAGATVLVLDEYPEPGGQYFKQLPKDFRVPDRERLGNDYTRGDLLLDKVKAAGVQLMNDALVWASFAPGTLEVVQKHQNIAVSAKAIVVAAGAYERPAVFPGWDLPGVMTPGGAQTLVKNQRTLPGERIVLAGSGPFLMPVASTLLQAGARIETICEATTTAEWRREMLGGITHLGRMSEAVNYGLRILTSRVPLRFGHVVVRAEGTERLERVVLSRCDADGRAVPGTREVITADTLCVGYGFVPAVQMTRLLGCRHRYDAPLGGWVPEHNELMETSVEGVFVAGEVAGIGGAHAAMAEGEIAGLAAAERIGLRTSSFRIGLAQAARRNHRAFGAVLNRVFAPKPALTSHITDDTIVCRCEEVTAGEIRAAAHAWSPNVNVTKGVTRCGMGLCQGRICGTVAETLVAQVLNKPPGSVDHFRGRLPVKPVLLGDVAAMDDAAPVTNTQPATLG